MLPLRSITGIDPDPRSVVPGLGISDTLYGIEIEIENVRNRPDTTWWHWTDDGSLRNHGAELITRMPTGGSDLEKALKEFKEVMETLANSQAQPPQITDRCSVHTHIDFRGSTVDQALSFFLGFCVFESALFTIGGKDRYDSIYCPGLSSCKPLIKDFNKLYEHSKSGNTSAIGHGLRNWSKYTAVNLSSIMTHGSVEVRSHKGTTEPEDIILWIRVLDTLKQYTDAVPPDVLVSEAVSKEVSFAREVFGDLSSVILTDNYTEFRNNNIRNALDCLYWKKIETFNKPEISSDARALAEAVLNILES